MNMSNVLAMLFVVLPAGGPPSGIGELRTDTKNLILIIPGAQGVDKMLSSFAFNLQDSMGKTDETRTQIWDWTRIALDHARPVAHRKPRAKDGRKLFLPHRDPQLGRLLAKHIADWRRERANANLYLMGLGEGSEVILSACRAADSNRAIIPDKSFKRVIFFGATLPYDVDLAPIARACQEPIYNYASARDSLLEYRKVKTAGLRGLKVGDSAPVVELKWDPAFRKLGNHGDHFQWANPKFADKYVLPLLSESPNALPAEWLPKDVGGLGPRTP